LSGPGFVTCQRRWVHVFINGYYWGVYDLEEHLDADTVSAHILAAIPSPTAEQKEQLNASNILFGKPTQLPDYAPATVEEQWWFNTVVPNALAVRGGSPPGTPAAAFSVLADGLGIVPSGGLHIDRYIDYICTIQVTEDQDLSEDNIRVWRHPVDLKWRCIAWDGDYIGWYGNHTFFPSFLNSDTFDLDRIGFYQLAPHNAVKFNPDYASAFSARLQTHLAGPLSQAALAARFNALAEDFRLTLECEALRWGRNIAGSTEASTLWSQNMIPIREAVTRPFAALPETPSTYNTLIKGGIQNGYLPTNFPYLPTSPP
jgi:hypothetical protein